MTLGYIYGWISVATGAYMLFFTLANILYLKRVSHPAARTSGPMVSVLIPARNEAKRIGPALDALRNQDYENYEVIILDDNSEDNTWTVISETCGNDPRFRILRGRNLEQGWKGKPFAMKQLAESAGGEILLFIDADMRPQPSLLSWTVTNLEDHGVDFLSGYPRHTTPESIEYLLFPVMYLATSFLLPLWLFRHSRSYMFSHAIGQFFCVRNAVLKEAGGLAAVKDKINEDIQLARHLKNCGFKQVFLDAKKQILGNMYDSIPHAKMGVMRVIYEYFDNLVYPFLFMGFVILFFLLLPPLVAIFALAAAAPWAWLCVLSVVLVLGAWSTTMIDRNIPWYTAFLYPIQFGWTLILSIRSIVLSKKGKGYLWKGRIVR